jgi:stage II sporulation protein D
MQNKKTALWQIIIILFLCVNSYALERSVQKNIRVGIILDVSSFMVGSSKEFFIYDTSDKKFKLTKGNAYITCSAKGVHIGKYDLPLPVKIKPSNGVIFANYKPYQGYLKLIKSDNKINVINVLTIEDYLKGVLPKEVSIDWEIEALKTQAVVSRTYIIANLNRHSDQLFDICSTTHCQVYGGLEVKAYSTDQAIKETKGEVLIYDDKFAQTVFHANCSGHTDDPKYIWNWKYTPPYLRGVKCGYCYDAPHSKWEHVLDTSFISEKLASKKIGKIKKIKVKGKTASGAAKELEITHSDGKLILNAYQFRLTVDAWKLKSHVFGSIKTNEDKIYFKGRGWGHKAGLCQWGAKGMAENGKTYKKILSHFYPGTKIETVVYNNINKGNI